MRALQELSKVCGLSCCFRKALGKELCPGVAHTLNVHIIT